MKLNIKRHHNQTVRIYNSDGKLMCICYNEVEFHRARVEIIKAGLSGSFIIKDNSNDKIAIDSYGHPSTWDGLYEETNIAIHNVLEEICKMRKKSKGVSHGG